VGLLATAWAVGGLPSCVPSNVVAVEDRAVVAAVETIEWGPAAETDIPGLYASMSIAGPAAASLLKIYYLFSADGALTAAALLDTPTNPEFQVLTGSWRFVEGKLELDGAEPADVQAAEGFLRLSGAEGVVVLRREVVQ